MAKNARTGYRRLFSTLDEAGEALGVTPANLSSVSIDGRTTRDGWLVRRVERVFALHLKAHDLWVFAVENSRGGYVEYGNPSRRYGESEWDEVRDVTVGWYLQDA